MAPRRLHGEDGVSLAIALGFLMLFGILIPAIVQFGGNSLLDTARLKEQRGDVYVADAGLDGAIQFLRQPANATCGLPLAPSCTFSTGVLNGKSANVSITARGGVFEQDRTVDLVANVGGKDRATASVVIRDSSTAAEPPVDVKSWTYNR
jgi:hypothetical protein